MPIDFADGTLHRIVTIETRLWTPYSAECKAEEGGYLKRSRSKRICGNSIMYRATPSDNSNSFRGLALEVMHSGKFEDFNAYCRELRESDASSGGATSDV